MHAIVGAASWRVWMGSSRHRLPKLRLQALDAPGIQLGQGAMAFGRGLVPGTLGLTFSQFLAGSSVPVNRRLK